MTERSATSAYSLFGPEGLLRFSVSGFCLGWSLWLFGKLGSQTGGWLLFLHDVPHRTIGLGERTAAWALLGIACIVWIRSWGMLAVVAAALAAFDASIGSMMKSYVFAEYALAAHGLRIAAPLCLALWVAGAKFDSERLALAGTWVLRLGAATVFATHGVEAILGHPGFQDFLIGTVDGLLGVALMEEHVRPALVVIGTMDLILALSILTGRWRSLLLVAATWGLVTALARTTTYGWGAYVEVLVRLPHAAAPLALWLLSSRADSKSSRAAVGDAQQPIGPGC